MPTTTPTRYRWTLLATDDRNPHTRTGGYPVESAPSTTTNEEEARNEGERERHKCSAAKRARLFVRVDRCN